MTEPNASMPTGPVIVHVFGRTDVGRTREHNEDAFVIADLTANNASLQNEVRTHTLGERGSLFMVADGMGGAAAGELASQMATEVVLSELVKRWGDAETHDPDTFVACLRAAGEAANAHINEYAAKHPENRGMGSTATIAGILGDTLYVAQVGDSRGYLVRGGTARQITRDQSLVQRLVDAGEITAEEAEMSDRRNIILQALGPEPSVKIEITHQRVKRGDVLILCSDGLSGQVRGDEIGEVVAKEQDLVGVCRRLIELANEAGGPDNITVVAARFDGEGLEAAGDGNDDVGHHVFQMDAERRVTLEVQVVPDDIADLQMAPTIEVTPVNPASIPPMDAPMARVTSAPSELAMPAPRGPSLATLRFMFIALGIVVATVFALKWLRK